MAIATAMAGCGGTSAPSNPLIGSWIVYGASEATFAGFREDGSYNWGGFLIDANGVVDTQEDVGTYTSSNGVLVFTAEKSTCADRPKASHVNYIVTGNEMIWSGQTSSLAFTRNTTDISSGGTTGLILYGCFESGAFVQGPFYPL